MSTERKSFGFRDASQIFAELDAAREKRKIPRGIRYLDSAPTDPVAPKGTLLKTGKPVRSRFNKTSADIKEPEAVIQEKPIWDEPLEINTTTIADLVAKGLTVLEIADRLDITQAEARSLRQDLAFQLGSPLNSGALRAAAKKYLGLDK